MMKSSYALLFSALATALGAAAGTKPVYQNDFENAAVGKVPEDLMVLEGAFGVKEADGNKFLELPGAPLETFGVLFGPTERAGVTAAARIHGTGKGRRFPTFGLGLNGGGGYRLQVSPAKKLLELYKNDEVLASAPFLWDSDTWTILRLQVRRSTESAWHVEGKAWKQGTPEPAGWLLTHAVTLEPTAGRASIWGCPYSGTPLRFDDLSVAKLATDAPTSTSGESP